MIDLIDEVEQRRAALEAGAWRPSPAARRTAAALRASGTAASSVRSAQQEEPASELAELLGHVAAVLDLPTVHESTSRKRLISSLDELIRAVPEEAADDRT